MKMVFSTGRVMNRTPPIRGALLASVAITVAIYAVPFGRTMGYPFVLLSTFVHEMGHGIATLLMGGNFHAFELFQDASGVAHTSGHFGRFAQGFVAAGGLVGPAIGAAICFIAARSPKTAQITLATLGFLGVACDVLVVRNLFGVFFVGALAAMCLWVAFKSSLWMSQTVLLLFGVQLSLSVFSRADYLFTQVAQTSMGPMPSDVEQMAQAWFLPYWVWGAMCGLFSVACLAIGIRPSFSKSHSSTQ